MTPSTPDPTRRNEHSRRAILAAAVDLISELGYEQVSIEAIARRAGVGKQTIYRWWPSKGAVALEALDDSLSSVVSFPDSDDLVEDLRTQMKGVTRLLGSTQVGPVYQGLIAAAQSDPALSRAHLDTVIEPAIVACRERLARARQHGQLRADADEQALIDMLYGAIYYRLLLHTRPLEEDQVDAVLDIAVKGFQ
ncbi:TetR/AcrR family transcriptional regulator [Pseudonocardia spinosispora]|uniref:TetR/AcrR family transcriptional regulator n=1 Tax=Pseudonocardia spinosispora TaxID=103441 RepID=UPI000423B07A|nr:TetR/AcrR family transcriptional regulator [Pseudonocardia spinosispora]